MLLVQEYLLTHTFRELAAEHGVYASFSKSGHKWSLNYDQIEAKESDLLAQQCRGLILSAEDGHSFTADAVMVNGRINYDHIVPGKTTVISYPMNRFFNHGQGAAAKIDWSDPGLSILEKMDGTLCIVYWDKFTNQFCVATRSVPEADLPMDNGIFTFRTLFEKALKESLGYDFEALCSHLDKSYTYCFELTTPYNRIVVNYPTNSITLLAARNLKTMKEEVPSKLGIVTVLGVPVVREHTYTSIEEIVNWVSSLNPLEHEGVVVCDSKFNRIKVKNAGYIAYNKLHDRLGSSERNLMEFILLETDDDIISALAPEIGENMVKLKAGLQLAISKYDSVFYLIMLNLSALGETKNKKRFALMVANHKNMWQAPFFKMFDGKCSSMKDFIIQNRKDGTWGNSFLDKILELSKSIDI